MNELITQNKNLTMDSLEIAKLTNKQHRNVTSDIVNMLNELNYDCWNFSSDYKAWNWQTYKKYILPKKLTLNLVSWYSAKLREIIIDRLEELENKSNWLPQNYWESLRMLAATWEQNEVLVQEKKILQLTVEEQAPKVAFADAIWDAKDWVSVWEFCKELSWSWIDIWQNRLFQWFRDNKILMKRDSQHTPYETHKKYFNVIVRKQDSYKWDRIFLTCKINGAGQRYFFNRLNKELWLNLKDNVVTSTSWGIWE